MIDALEGTLNWLATNLPSTLRKVDPKVGGVAVVIILYSTAVFCTSYYQQHGDDTNSHSEGSPIKSSPPASLGGSPTKYRPLLGEKFTTQGLSPNTVRRAITPPIPCSS